jgi:hypothetical protein
MPEYQEIIIETYLNWGEPSADGIRARPLPGQGFPISMRVECSSGMRHKHPVGTKFKILAKETSREGGARFLYTHYSWPFEAVSDDIAASFIRERFGSA